MNVYKKVRMAVFRRNASLNNDPEAGAPNVGGYFWRSVSEKIQIALVNVWIK